MSALLREALTAAFVWCTAGILLAWASLSEAWRRRVALAFSAGGLVFLALAMNTEGLHEAPTVAGFLLGSPHVLERAAASASLPYYVATGVCLLVGTAGLALGEERVHGLASRWLGAAIGLSLVMTALRFTLEKVAAPPSWTHAVGIVWLAPVVGAFFQWRLQVQGERRRNLVRALVTYALSVRGAVAAFMVVATLGRFGSHYDVSRFVVLENTFGLGQVTFVPGSARQILTLAVVPQLVFWPAYTVLAGLLGAGLLRLTTAEAANPLPGSDRG